MVNGTVENVTCESRNSYPAPELKWFLGDNELGPFEQNNTLEPNELSARMWTSDSTLQYTFTLNDSQILLSCRVHHPAYTESPQVASVSLNILCKSCDIS